MKLNIKSNVDKRAEAICQGHEEQIETPQQEKKYGK